MISLPLQPEDMLVLRKLPPESRLAALELAMTLGASNSLLCIPEAVVGPLAGVGTDRGAEAVSTLIELGVLQRLDQAQPVVCLTSSLARERLRAQARARMNRHRSKPEPEPVLFTPEAAPVQPEPAPAPVPDPPALVPLTNPLPGRKPTAYSTVEIRAVWEAYPANARGGPGAALRYTREALAHIEATPGHPGAAEPLQWLLGRVQTFAASWLGSRGQHTKGLQSWLEDQWYDRPDSDWDEPRSAPAAGQGPARDYTKLAGGK